MSAATVAGYGSSGMKLAGQERHPASAPTGAQKFAPDIFAKKYRFSG
jgi:hypothetical protein